MHYLHSSSLKLNLKNINTHQSYRLNFLRSVYFGTASQQVIVYLFGNIESNCNMGMGILCFVVRASLYNLVNKANFVHNFFVWFTGWKILQTRQSLTQSNTYQVSHRYSYFSWWWLHSCPKHVEKGNKHTKKNRAPVWLCLQDGNGKFSARYWARPDRFIFRNVTLIWWHHCFNTCLIWKHLYLTPPPARHCSRSQFYTLFIECFGDRAALFPSSGPVWCLLVGHVKG
jgi:hypothetical protein